MKTTAIPAPRGQTGHCLVGTWQACAFKPPFPSLRFLLWLMTSPAFQGGRKSERSLMEVIWHIVGAQFVPTGKAGGPQIWEGFRRTWQGWGWRVGQDRGHFPASEHKAGPLTNRKGQSRWKDWPVLRHCLS